MEMTNILQCVENVTQLFKDMPYEKLSHDKVDLVVIALKRTMERQDILESAFNALEARVNKLENNTNKKSKSKLLDETAPFECDNNNATK